MTTPTTSTTTAGLGTGNALGLLTPAAYRRTLHLLADLPIGLITCTAIMTQLALCPGLAIIMIGIPLLLATLHAARYRAGGRAPGRAPSSASTLRSRLRRGEGGGVTWSTPRAGGAWPTGCCSAPSAS